MTGCQTCGGFGMHHDEACHGGWGPPGIPWTLPAPEAECSGICVMGNEVMPHGGHYDIAAYPDPDCPRHGDAA